MSLTPTLADIRYTDKMFQDYRIWILSGDDFQALMSLVKYSAARRVWTYDPPTDGGIEDSDRTHRIAGFSKRKWKKTRERILHFFEQRDGKLYPPEGWIEIVGGYERPAFPPHLRVIVGDRDQWTCGYCGSRDGPFDIDHVVPVARGGHLTSLENLLLACARCNRSKGAKLVAEWVR